MSLKHEHIAIDDASLHVVSAGDPGAPPILFLHGWPEDWSAWAQVLPLAASSHYALALDLPGIGESREPAPNGRKSFIAGRIHALVSKLGLKNVNMVGHDVGGMATYAYLRRFGDLSRAVIMDTVIPGIEPWDEVRRNPYIWHFAFHAVAGLPELLVRGHQGPYFDFFYDQLSAEPSKISKESRERYVAAYRSDQALRQGFEFYRAFPGDAEENQAFAKGAKIETPVLYLRGSKEGGEIQQYVGGLRAAGLTQVSQALIGGVGHFSQEEAPDEVWKIIRKFVSG
jgi:pimeloyl-ACP methyl ester carboxylesterase